MAKDAGVNLNASLEEEATLKAFFYLIDLMKQLVNNMNAAGVRSEYVWVGMVAVMMDLVQHLPVIGGRSLPASVTINTCDSFLSFHPI